MNAALLITDSADTRRTFAGLIAGKSNLIPVPPPGEPSREKFDALFSTWLRLVDWVIVDAVALGQMTRWAVESLASGAHGELPVVVRLSDAQRKDYSLPANWLVLIDADSPEQLQQSVRNFLELHTTKASLNRPSARPTAEPIRMTTTPMEPYRYRDALKNLSRLLGQRHRAGELPVEFMRLVRDFLGVGKLAIFTRRLDEGLFAGSSSNELTIACSHGVAEPVTEHLRLALDAGIAGRLAREVRILRRRDAADDARIEREFDLLGTEVAVPMFDTDQLAGVLTFSGKITGEPVTNDELELVYQLASQFSQAIRNGQLSERVSAQQRLMSEVLAHVHTGVLVVDQDERIVAINDQLRSLLDLDRAALAGQELGRLPGRVADVVFEALNGGAEALDREIVMPRTNRPLRVRVARFEAETGKAAVVVALVDDLTQEKLQQSREREVADKEFLMRLAFRLSHELKNSLVSIKIFAQLLPERYSEKEFREQFSSVVVNEVNRVDVLINNLTFFSHPLALVHEPVVLTDLLESCLKNVGNEFARKQLAQLIGVGEKPAEGVAMPVVTLKKTFAHKFARLEGDKLRLMQAFEHVLRNSLQAMPAGGRLHVATSDADAADFPDGHAPTGGAIKIELQDTGEGVALPDLPRLTEPFVTTRNVGVGLGLTIVKKIVERHGGRLEIDSMLGRGTTVKILLPVQAQPHPEDALLHEITKETGAVAGHGESSDGPSRLPTSLGR